MDIKEIDVYVTENRSTTIEYIFTDEVDISHKGELSEEELNKLIKRLEKRYSTKVNVIYE